MKKVVSIIVPVYNVEQYIKRCIDSILEQTYKDIEVILVDDGSLDYCGKICDEYSIRDSRIKVIHKENGGLSDARNAGYKKCSGDYIMFVDSDDWIEKNMVEIMVNNIEKNKSDLAMCGTKTAGDYSFEFNDWFDSDFSLRKDEALQLLIKNELITSHAWNKIYKKELFKDIEWPKGKLYEDIRIMHNIFEKCDSISISKEYLYNYYQREDSICGSDKIKTKFEFVDAFIKRNDDIAKFGLQYKEISMYKMAMYIAHLFLDNNFTKNEKVQYRKKINTYKRILNDRDINHIIKKIAPHKEKAMVSFAKMFYCNSNKIYKLCKRLFMFVSRKIKNKVDNLYINEEDLNKINVTEKNIILMGNPEYNNLGDHAIAYATRKFIEDNFPTFNFYNISEKLIRTRIGKLKKVIKDEDILLLQGGGNMGDIYEDQVLIRKKVITAFPRNKIIIMPQTIHFNNQNVKVFPDYYINHRKLHIATREKKSYEIVKNMNHNNVFLVPDIVMYMIKYSNLFSSVNKSGTIVCIRNDKEKDASSIALTTIKECLVNNNIKYTELDTVVENSVSDTEREKYLYNLFHKFSSAKLIITDRLHGMIFAAITKTPCIVLPTFNHKVINSYKWLEGSNYIKLYNNNDDFEKMLKELYLIDPQSFDLDNYFEELKKCINN